MIEKGDKVRFIDEALEGTVIGLVGNDGVQVLTMDGFTVVTSYTKLVKVRDGNEDMKMGREEAPVPVPEPEAARPAKVKGKVFAFSETALKEEIIYAAFEVLEPSSPLASAVQLHLVNNTDYTIAFSLSKKFEMRDEGIAADVMAPRSVKSFLTYTQDSLKTFEAFRVQVIVHPNGKAAFRPPLQKQFRFNATDLLESNDFNVGVTNCLFIQLADLKQAAEVDITSLINKFEKQKPEPDKPKAAKPSKSSKNIIYADDKIVDLHIEELVKDFTSMSNGQIIALQLKHFQYEMDKAILNHLRKITFIHGVGQGILKSAIREELKKFPGIEVNDAPVEKFGYGATEVIFK